MTAANLAQAVNRARCYFNAWADHFDAIEKPQIAGYFRAYRDEMAAAMAEERSAPEDGQ